MVELEVMLCTLSQDTLSGDFIAHVGVAKLCEEECW